MISYRQSDFQDFMDESKRDRVEFYFTLERSWDMSGGSSTRPSFGDAKRLSDLMKSIMTPLRFWGPNERADFEGIMNDAVKEAEKRDLHPQLRIDRKNAGPNKSLIPVTAYLSILQPLAMKIDTQERIEKNRKIREEHKMWYERAMQYVDEEGELQGMNTDGLKEYVAQHE